MDCTITFSVLFVCKCKRKDEIYEIKKGFNFQSITWYPLQDSSTLLRPFSSIKCVVLCTAPFSYRKVSILEN